MQRYSLVSSYFGNSCQEVKLVSEDLMALAEVNTYDDITQTYGL